MTDKPKLKQTEVGMIPSDWEVKTLGELVDMSSGTTPSRFNEKNFQGNVCWLSSGELKSHYIYNTKEKISEDAASSMRLYPKGTVVIAMYGLEAEGVRGTSSILAKECTISQACMAFTNLREINNEYFYYWYAANGNEIGTKYAQGTKQQNLSPEVMKNVIIPLPPTIEEQQRIANALSDVDTLIANLEKLIAKKKNIKQGAMQQLLTGKKRLPGFTGKWSKKIISKIGFTYNGLSGKIASDFGKGSSLYVTFLNVLNNPVIDKRLFQKVNVSESENQNKVLRDDLLFNTSSEIPEEVGICSVLKTDVPNLYLNSFCFGFRLIDKTVDGLFLSYYFRSSLGRNIMSLLAQGSTRYNLSKDNFLKSSIVIPPSKAEQTAIANVLSDMDTEISALETKLAKYRTLKTGMMQQLLTGKIRLV